MVQLKFCYSINLPLMLVTRVQALLMKWQFWLSAPTDPDYLEIEHLGDIPYI